ncbi:MAG: hypothetical protein MR472_00725 [Parafannyhessea umbonata]|uniref:hypothetical protein n=1 Tax=Parafannyhessea umbonata TaxID=604330 RepID=UPI0026EC2C41|nr:hypothetical protein [Parafannyhessea umbonata]MCI6680946.1 hypothetical protein [Parafannyhessea umbonata]
MALRRPGSPRDVAIMGPAGAATLVALLAVVGFAVSLVCYVLYYRLGALPSFVDGCIPLALIGVVSVVIAGCIGFAG